MCKTTDLIRKSKRAAHDYSQLCSFHGKLSRTNVSLMSDEPDVSCSEQIETCCDTVTSYGSCDTNYLSSGKVKSTMVITGTLGVLYICCV